MSLSRNDEPNQFPWTGPYAVPDYPDLPRTDDPDVERVPDSGAEGAYDPADTREPPVLPAPFAEKARAAAHGARGTGSDLWTAVRAHKAVTGGAAVGAAAALALAHVWGRRAGRRAARRGLGPVALLFERRL
ncbi:hypothetical protein ACFQ8C_17220 [Streptomyces sp. NPDC056503]|uniref:hypothetical protein n=1 Tax=Streptomyces sp. NPDC056503 TaxID=3345842 RepID=UPI0036770767